MVFFTTYCKGFINYQVYFMHSRSVTFGYQSLLVESHKTFIKYNSITGDVL